MDKSTWWLTRVWYPSSAPPSLFFRRASGLLFWRHYSLFFPIFLSSMCCSFSPKFLLGGYCMHWGWPSRCLLTGCHWQRLWFPTFWDIFSTVVWLGLATCWRRTSERNLSVGSLHALVLCFTRFHQVLGWSSCLALSNQQACVRPYCFTGRPRPLRTSFSTGSMVLSFWSAPSSLEIPALRVPRYRLAPSPAKLPVSYPFFLSSPCTNFDPTDFCHLRRRSNLLIYLFAIFGLNDNVVLFCFNSVTSKCGSWYADCRALCPGPSSQEDRTLAAWSKKKISFIRKPAPSIDRLRQVLRLWRHSTLAVISFVCIDD